VFIRGYDGAAIGFAGGSRGMTLLAKSGKCWGVPLHRKEIGCYSCSENDGQ